MDRKLGLEFRMDIALWAFFEKANKKDVLSFNVCKSIVQF
jgi:hypothetical protein